MRLTENKRHKKLFKKITDISGFYTCDGFNESIDKDHIKIFLIHPQLKLQHLTKIMNIDILVVGTSNQLFIRSY